jgi:hypothetical protein
MGIIRDPFGQTASEAVTELQRQPSASSTQPITSARSAGLAQPSAPSPSDAGRSELSRRRDALAEEVTELHWDLGGLAYEMAIRDHFRLDVLVRRAALLQERDAELAEVERLLRMELDGVAGACPSCAAPHSRGALYCWQCGATLMERQPSAAVAEHDGTSSMMEELLAHQAASASEPAASSDE